MKSVGIYTRVSTTNQTIEQQRALLQDYCHQSGYKIVDFYIDEGESALKSNRPAYQRLLEDVRRRKINTVLVYKLDRFSRSLKELVNSIGLLKDCGCDFISYTERHFDSTTAAGQLMFNITAAFAEFERSMISERTKLKLSHLKNKGIKLGRPQKADFNQIALLRAEGLSLRQIAQQISCDKSTVSKALKKANYAEKQRLCIVA